MIKTFLINITKICFLDLNQRKIFIAVQHAVDTSTTKNSGVDTKIYTKLSEITIQPDLLIL